MTSELALLRQVRIYDDAIPPAWVERLRPQVVNAPQGATSTTSTTWYSLADSPSCFFEQVVRRLHAVARPPPECTGAEYWMRAQNARATYAFHFDSDEALASIVTPSLSSILYLSDVGGPTLIMGTVPTSKGGPVHGVGVTPHRGRYATFPGQLFHGVGPGRQSRWPRIAFFANWWTKRPAGAVPRAPPERSMVSPLLKGAPEVRSARPAARAPDRFKANDVFDEAKWLSLLEAMKTVARNRPAARRAAALSPRSASGSARSTARL